MTLQELEEHIRLGEDSRTEFKEERAHPDALAAAMVSFANGEGGAILLGVADNRTVTGVSNSDEKMLTVDEIRRQNVEPPITNMTLEKHSLQGAMVLVVNVPRGSQRPYRTNKGVYYLRSMAGRRIASRQELLEIFQAGGSLFPDELPAEDAGLADVDRDYLFQIRPELAGMTDEDLVRTLINVKLMADPLHLTLGGLLCFGAAPERVRQYARITAIRHTGIDVTEALLGRQEIGGPVARQVRSAQAFVRKYFPAVPAQAAQPIYPPPVEAVDQAIVNAVAHRDYLAPAQVRLFVFDDRIEVVSPGRLLNSVTVELMCDGCHFVRNPLVFHHLARLGLAIDAGRGIPTMFALMRARGLPDPEVSPSGIDLRVVFRLLGGRA